MKERLTEKKVVIHVYQNPEECPEAFEWVEIEKKPQGFFPVHARDIPTRIRHLIKYGAGYKQDTIHVSTVSAVALATFGWMVRWGELGCPVHVYYHREVGRDVREQSPDGDLLPQDKVVRFDIEGIFIEPWPEEPDSESIESIVFYLRYDSPEFEKFKT